MQPWWQTVAALGQDALIWLLGLATHGGTDRDKPPTLGAGRTSNVAHELGKARRYASKNNLEFEAKKGYQRLRRVAVQAKNGEQDTIFTRAKGGGHMQLTPRVGITIFHHICSDMEFRRYLQTQIGIEQEESPTQAEFPPDAPIQITIEKQIGIEVTVLARFLHGSHPQPTTHRNPHTLLRQPHQQPSFPRPHANTHHTRDRHHACRHARDRHPRRYK